MKKILLTVSVVLLKFIVSYSQNTYPWPSSGNVGIGIADPGAKALHVRSNATNHSAVIENLNPAGYGLILHSAFDPLRVGVLGNTEGKYLKVASNGYVGIGTTSPQYKLDIATAGVSGLNISGNNSSYVGPDIMMSRSTTSGGVGRGAALQFNDTGSGSFNIIQGSTAGIQFFNNYNNAGWVERMCINGAGNVGIGTSAPDTKLTVKGIIHTNEVRVDMNAPIQGPDYVFETDYHLLPLTELEVYIRQNKHLPEVPSAKEMETNGLNLKEMNLLLLKKVEELTLHVIELKKENIAQQKEIEVLKKKE